MPDLQRSAPKLMQADPAELAEADRINRVLARTPRFKIRNRLDPLVIQSLLLISQVGGDRRLQRRGVSVETRQAVFEGVSVPVRLLRPAGPARGVVLDVHGGGWAIGNARLDDGLNAALVRGCGVAVAAVDYRLAGRAPIAGLMDDCLAAALWLLAGEGAAEFEGLPVFIAGESAGGHLAAATLLRLQARPHLLRRVTGAVLYYGVYDLAGSPSVRRAGPETLVLDGPGMLKAMRLLTPEMDDAARRQPPLSPLYGDLRGLPPAFMIAGELDPLLDDTLVMAARWAEVADVELHLAPRSPHGFIRFRSALARRALDLSRAWINSRLLEAEGRG